MERVCVFNFKENDVNVLQRLENILDQYVSAVLRIFMSKITM